MSRTAQHCVTHSTTLTCHAWHSFTGRSSINLHSSDVGKTSNLPSSHPSEHGTVFHCLIMFCFYVTNALILRYIQISYCLLCSGQWQPCRPLKIILAYIQLRPLSSTPSIRLHSVKMSIERYLSRSYWNSYFTVFYHIRLLYMAW